MAKISQNSAIKGIGSQRGSRAISSVSDRAGLQVKSILSKPQLSEEEKEKLSTTVAGMISASKQSDTKTNEDSELSDQNTENKSGTFKEASENNKKEAGLSAKRAQKSFSKNTEKDKKVDDAWRSGNAKSLEKEKLGSNLSAAEITSKTTKVNAERQAAAEASKASEAAANDRFNPANQPKATISEDSRLGEGLSQGLRPSDVDSVIDEVNAKANTGESLVNPKDLPSSGSSTGAQEGAGGGHAAAGAGGGGYGGGHGGHGDVKINSDNIVNSFNDKSFNDNSFNVVDNQSVEIDNSVNNNIVQSEAESEGDLFSMDESENASFQNNRNAQEGFNGETE